MELLDGCREKRGKEGVRVHVPGSDKHLKVYKFKALEWRMSKLMSRTPMRKRDL